MKPWRIPLLAALIAALFVLAPVAFADCPPGNPECELLPPESEEVNPDPGSGVGLAGEVASPGLLLPIQAVIPMPLPRLVDASPVTVAVGAPASVPGIEIPLRYQNPDDVSCGVQALGMALDGLEGAAPTSSALLGFLQDQGMMYDYGTGVEELAYAAQSFGYRGSYAFHGATLEDLAAQLAAGSPVVVSLGANGEGAPGHFVTVTGISADGKWVSYNDPTLGRQVIPADEFTRLWGLQGNSGVAVLKDVPAGAPDYTPWVALMAGVMALVSMTPLGARRQGVGGRVDSGGGGSKAKSAPKSAPKAAPKPAPKSAPKPAPKAAPKPAPAPAPAPRARFDEEPAPAPKPAPAPAPAPRARFDEEPAPAPRPMPAPAPAPKPAPVAGPAPRPPIPPQPAPSLFGLITSAVSSAVTTVSTAVQHTVSTVSNTVSRAVSTASTAVRNAVSTTVNRAADFVDEVADEARQIGQSVAMTVSQAAATVSNAVRTTAQSVGNTVRTATTAAVSTLRTVADRAAESVSNTARNVAVSALTAVHEAVTAATPIAQRIVAAPFIAAHDAVEEATPLARDILVSVLAPAADSLRSIADHERNPQIASWREGVLGSIQNSVDGWRQAFEGAGALGAYTLEALADQRWDDVARAAYGWRTAGEEVRSATLVSTLQALGMVAWGAVTTPYRLVTQSIPNFGRAVSERLEGEDRAWDVIFSGVMLEGDIAGTYALGQVTGVNVRINTAAVRATSPMYPSVRTPHGISNQDLSPAALELRSQVEAGLPVYRAGILGRNAAAEAQFWAPESPFAPAYASRYGAPFSEPDFILGGTLREGAVFTTGPAAGLGTNPGGALEIVTGPGVVHLDFFHMVE